MRATLPLLVVLAAAAVTAPASAQNPVWDHDRHLVVVTSDLDSAAAHAAVVRAFEAEGLTVQPSDSARGRIICAPRPSDSYGGATATVWYVALVHRLPGGGSEIWLGGLLHTRALATAATPDAFPSVRSNTELQPRPEGNTFYVAPSGGSSEWRRLQRVAEQVSRAAADRPQTRR